MNFIGSTDSSSVGLVEPCEELISSEHRMEELFRLNYEKLQTASDICQKLYKIVYPCCDFKFLFNRHPEHAIYLSEKLTKLYIVMQIFYAVKFRNRELTRSGKPKVALTVKRAQDGRKMQKILHN